MGATDSLEGVFMQAGHSTHMKPYMVSLGEKLNLRGCNALLLTTIKG